MKNLNVINRVVAKRVVLVDNPNLIPAITTLAEYLGKEKVNEIHRWCYVHNIPKNRAKK